jgi:hypothetical protein
MGIAAIAHGGYRLVYIEVKPDQECVMVVRGESVTEPPIPRATIPGNNYDICYPSSNIRDDDYVC